MIKNKRLIILSLLLLSSSCSKKTNDIDIQKSRDELHSIAIKINDDFIAIENEVKELAEMIEKLYSDESKNEVLKAIDKSNYKVHKSGIFYKEKDDNGSAVYVSMNYASTPEIQDIVNFTTPMD